VSGVYSAQLEVLLTYFHLTFDEIAELTPLQRDYLVKVFAKQNPRSSRRRR
jgi:hypothetical protein